MKRAPLERRTPLVAKTELKRTSPLKAASKPGRRSTLKPGRGFAVSQAQREKARMCIVCQADLVHPAHVIDRSLVPDDDGDPRRVVGLCPMHHREYDDGSLSILEYLEPHYRSELAYAVELVGLITALERITNQRWRAIA